MNLTTADYEGIRLGLEVLQFVGFIGLALYTHLTAKSKANTQAIDEVMKANTEANNAIRRDFEGSMDHLEERITRTERRSDVLESRQNEAPNHNDLAKVYERLNKVAESMENQNGHLSALSHQLSMVNQYLLNQKGGHGQ